MVSGCPHGWGPVGTLTNILLYEMPIQMVARSPGNSGTSEGYKQRLT